MYFRRLVGLMLPVASIAASSARLRDGRLHGNMVQLASVPIVDIPDPNAPVTSRNGTILPPYNTTYYFDQLIDHNNPSLGTFKQRFWHTYEFYEAGMSSSYFALSPTCPEHFRGGPIILFTPGEINANGTD